MNWRYGKIRKMKLNSQIQDAICNEIKRGTITLLNSDLTTRDEYCADVAQRIFKERQLNKGRSLKLSSEDDISLFLEDKIGFLDIGRLVEGVVDSDAFGGGYTLDDVYECDRMARAYVRSHL